MDTTTTPEEKQALKENEIDKNTQATELKEEELNEVNGGSPCVSQKFKDKYGIGS